MTIREALEILKKNSTLVYVCIDERVWFEAQFTSRDFVSTCFICSYQVKGRYLKTKSAKTLEEVIEAVEKSLNDKEKQRCLNKQK